MNPYEISPDRPLISSGHDVLGRRSFSEQLAKALLAFQQPESLVVGLLGPWGSGKSTVLNFIAEYFEDLPKPERPILFSFNPWLFSSREDLLSFFLKELAVKLNKKDYEEVFKRIEEFSSVINEGLGGIIGVKIPPAIFNFLKRPKSLLTQKEKLSDALKKSNRKIIIFIDDLDRLTPEEIRTVFQLIKAVCDFPNVLYIVSFDKKAVSKALEKFHGDKGDEYLEKIIQVPFELPSVDQHDLNRLFFEKLEQIIGQSDFESQDEEYDFYKVFHYGVEPYLKTPRDVIRLTNVFSLSYQAVKGEVYWIEFLAIETLKVFNTDLYNEIKDNKEKFVDLLHDNTDREEAKKYYNNLISQYPGQKQEKTKDLLVTLFPKVECVYWNRSYHKERTLDWRRLLRICSSDIFEVYFRLGFSETHLKNSDLQKLLQVSGNSEKFTQFFLEIARASLETDRIDSLLDRLLDYVEQHSFNQNTRYIVQSVFNIGDRLLQKTALKKRSFLDFGTDTKIGRLLYHLLKNYSDNSEIFSILKESSMNGKALYTIIDEIESVTSQRASRGPYFPKQEQNLTDEQSKELMDIGLKRIREFVSNNSLTECPNLLFIMYRWKEWTDQPDEVKNWILDFSRTPEKLKRLLVAITCRSTSSSSEGIRHKYFIKYSRLSNFIEPEALKANIQQVLDLNLLQENPFTKQATEKLLKEIDDPALRKDEHDWLNDHDE